MIKKFKINGLPTDKEFTKLSFGQKLDFLRAIEKFKTSNRSVWLSQKRQSYTKAIVEAIKLYNVTEYYCEFNAVEEGLGVHDDTFQFWFVNK